MDQDRAEVTCPSGLRGTLRGMTLREEDLLAERGERQGPTLDRLLEACWEETLDPGPYRWERFRARDLLVGDQVWLTLELRALSYGPDFEFKVTCPKGHTYTTGVELRELPRQPLPAPSAAALASGEPLTTFLPRSKTRVAYRLLTAADQRDLGRHAEEGKGLVTAVMRRRIVAVDPAPKDLDTWLARLPAYDAAWLRREVERADCGVDTTLAHECPRCGTRWEDELPLGPTFFSLGSTSPAAPA